MPGLKLSYGRKRLLSAMLATVVACMDLPLMAIASAVPPPSAGNRV